MKPVSVILIGAGDRGTTYIRKMKKSPDKYQIVAVADPVEGRKFRRCFRFPMRCVL